MARGMEPKSSHFVKFAKSVSGAAGACDRARGSGGLFLGENNVLFTNLLLEGPGKLVVKVLLRHSNE